MRMKTGDVVEGLNELMPVNPVSPDVQTIQVKISEVIQVVDLWVASLAGAEEVL